MNTYEKARAETLAQKTVEALKRRHFDAYYCSDVESAKELLLSLIPSGDTVSWGGSATLSELEIIPTLKERYECIDRADAAPEQKADFARRGLICGSFIMSANAISSDGVIVNIDGTGNRAAAMVFGPRQTIVVAGVNKITPNLDGAILRARNVAAPVNAQRFDVNTPCKCTGKCENCLGEDSICTNVVITRLSRPAGRIKVLLIGEKLGF